MAWQAALLRRQDMARNWEGDFKKLLEEEREACDRMRNAFLAIAPLTRKGGVPSGSFRRMLNADLALREAVLNLSDFLREFTDSERTPRYVVDLRDQCLRHPLKHFLEYEALCSDSRAGK